MVNIRKEEMEKRSNDSAKMLPYWEMAADLVEGIDALKAKEKQYLPGFENESKSNYDVRLSLTKYTNIISDIIENLASKPFEKDIKLPDEGKGTPEQIKTFVEDVDGAGNTLSTFAYDIFYNGIQYVVDWIFIDFPTIPVAEGRTRTREEEKQLGIKPFWTHVLGINVYDAQWKVIKGKEQLTYIKIHEHATGVDPEQFRIMYADENGARFEIWRKTDKLDEYYLYAEGPITIGIIPLVSFATGRRHGRRYFYKQPMRPAMELQKELYLEESGEKFSRTIAAYPMLSANGVKPDIDPTTKLPKPINIGPMKALYAPPDGNGNSGEWKFMQPDAGIFNYLKEDKKDTIQQLRELGRQPLTAQSGNLTVINSAFAASKSKTAVLAWAFLLKNAIEEALLITAMWMNVSYDPDVEIYTEFDNFIDGANDVDALGSMREKGDLSQETYWEEMSRRGILSDNFTAERERERLTKEFPSGNDIVDANGNPIVQE